MNYVFVKFSGTVKNDRYKTKLNLMKGATYKIGADGITTYASPVKVCSIVPTRPNFEGVGTSVSGKGDYPVYVAR